MACHLKSSDRLKQEIKYDKDRFYQNFIYGIFSKATLDDDLFDDKLNAPSRFWRFTLSPREKFYNSIKWHSDTLYIILDASIETCQKRIAERGDSLDCEFHNKKDLTKYKERFNFLVELCNGLPNVMLVNTD